MTKRKPKTIILFILNLINSNGRTFANTLKTIQKKEQNIFKTSEENFQSTT